VPLLSQATRRNPLQIPLGDKKSHRLSEIKIMNAIEVAKHHLDAWNCHDADAIVAAFAEVGTYSNPFTGEGVTGEPIGSFARGVFAAFPDASFDLISHRRLRDIWQ
jgi:hypothetical protein